MPRSTSKKPEYTCSDFPLERNGISLHLDRTTVSGEEPEKNILMMHGITYSSHEFDLDYKDYSLAKYMARNGYAVWKLDIAGYGLSGKPENGLIPNSDYAAEDINAAVDEILRITGKEKTDMLGCSWGTVTSSRFASKYPEKVNKLVLFAPIISGLGKEAVSGEYHKNDWQSASSDFQKLGSGEFDFTKAEKEVIDIYCSNCWRYDGEKSPGGGRFDIFVDRSEVVIDLKKITVPTLVICGDSDPYLDYDRVSSSLSNLPEGSVLKIIKGASHAAFLEKPYLKTFRSSVLSFLG